MHKQPSAIGQGPAQLAHKQQAARNIYRSLENEGLRCPRQKELRHLPDAVNGPSAVVETLLHGNGPGRRWADSGGAERFRECWRRADLKGQLHPVLYSMMQLII